ncbi:hypothetical protein SS50377_26814 [Spironucleus salmonicida]|uniref:Uncharacterized protein n=1 Tax=Spironucleus salmonicida TaxID=348837 RepID=V6LYG0_9EUKA|nr:hypothetical protein SS50377_26814 [Spironucleus salmonicida]|eukprot:EST49283.1 Hypothetical protein SS50377_10505 [Spironucleus salmonicida]
MKILNECNLAYEMELLKLEAVNLQFIKHNNLKPTVISAKIALQETANELELEKQKYIKLIKENDILQQDTLLTSKYVAEKQIISKNDIEQLTVVNQIQQVEVFESVKTFYKNQVRLQNKCSDLSLQSYESEQYVKEEHLAACKKVMNQKAQLIKELKEKNNEQLSIDSIIFNLEIQYRKLERQNLNLSQISRNGNQFNQLCLDQRLQGYKQQCIQEKQKLEEQLRSIFNYADNILKQFQEIQIQVVFDKEQIQIQELLSKQYKALRLTLNIDQNNICDMRKDLEQQVSILVNQAVYQEKQLRQIEKQLTQLNE